MSNNKDPLLVANIGNEKAHLKFQNVTKNLDMSRRNWLIFMAKIVSFNCQRPIGNLFNLQLNTQVLVKCKGNESIMKYYSIDGKSADVTEVAIWNIQANQLIPHLKIYEQLYKLDMKKINLRVAQVFGV